MDDSRLAFHGEFSPFSNFHKSPFKWKQHRFHCTEQFIQYQKAVTADDARVAEEILKCDTALEAKRAKSFNNTLKMVAVNVELTHQRLRTLENRTSMMVKAIMPVLDVLKGRIADTNQRLTSQYRMMQMAHHRYNLLFRWTHEMLMIHHFALLLFLRTI